MMSMPELNRQGAKSAKDTRILSGSFTDLPAVLCPRASPGKSKLQLRQLRAFAVGLLTIAALTLQCIPQGNPQAQDAAAQQRQALKDLSTAFSLMSVAAHPDDEDSEALTLMHMKWGVRTSIVVSNYGEGGQNAVGPELYDDLGGVRYHELHAAVERYGVSSVQSLGFVDFGFSKTAEETFRFWAGQDGVTRRLVAAIRKERPLVIITNHTVDEGHGNHRSVAISLQEAFRLAGKQDYHPELGSPWQALRMFQTQQKPEGAAVALVVGEVEPLTGRTYSEIARSAYREHASQGPFAVPYIQPRIRYYKLWDSATPENLAAADTFFAGMDQPFPPEIRMNLEAIQKRYQTMAQAQLVPDMAGAIRQTDQDAKTLEKMQAGLGTQFAGEKRNRNQTAIRDLEALLQGARARLAGLRATWDLVTVSEAVASKLKTTGEIDILLRGRPINEAVAADYAVFRIGIAGPRELGFKSVTRQWPRGWSESRILDGSSAPGIWTQYGIIRLPRDAELTEPFRLFYKKGDLPRISWRTMWELGAVAVPFDWSTYPKVFPRAQMAVSPDRWLAWKDQKVTATVRLTNNSLEALRGKLIAAGGAEMAVEVASRRTQTFQLPVEFRRGRSSNEVIRFEGDDGTRASAEIRVSPGDLQAPPVTRVGLLRHSDSTTEEALRNLGVPYQVIGRDELLAGDLGQYQTILVDHRSYVLIPGLAENNERLMDFVRNGGTLVVFYQRAPEFNVESGYPQLAPFPLHVSSNRVSVEEAPVRILLPNHPLLRRPNTVGPEEFSHWVQERGLYYPDQWDNRYQALLSSNDPDEKPLDGGLLTAPVGKGVYVYTTYVWYREWKELNNGAFRMLANLIGYRQGN